MSSRYSVLSEDYDPTNSSRPTSTSKPPSVIGRPLRSTSSRYSVLFEDYDPTKPSRPPSIRNPLSIIGRPLRSASSRYSVLSEEYDPTQPPRPLSVRKPPSTIGRPLKSERPRYQRGQICLVKESTFRPLSEALAMGSGPIDLREGISLTVKYGHPAPVSSGIVRPCIIMDCPPNCNKPNGRRQGYFICLMATFSSSKGDYRSLKQLLQRFVAPVEPNEQLLSNPNVQAFCTVPDWHHPQQWLISFVIHTTKPVMLYTTRNGEGRRLSDDEYNRLSQHCIEQRARWKHDTTENVHLRQEMYEELVNWVPKSRNSSVYTGASAASAMSVGSAKSEYYWQGPCMESVASLDPIPEHTASTYPTFTPDDFPPLRSPMVCAVH
ncbi:hypothetical protein EDD18DRAFT_1352864 [Armillaria luteobubalina]|uniref:Uncharacterized protein n=1 Tax=Armillaria luteobubalina TaxID=153913 RepID=A0AA39UXF4_9AGAR|nr:hypothetical protein EDD18DRAFT_1352864 [Armillaria luteobubalina]